MAASFQERIRERTLIFDGGMGTMLQAKKVAVDCSERLNLESPKVIEEIHTEYLEAGSDIVTTNTFGASRVVLADHGLQDRVREINLAAVAIARKATQSVAGPRLVAGDIGPTSKLPTLGHIAFNDLMSAYEEQIHALIEGGVDLLLIETCQDPLQIKAAAAAARSVMQRTNTLLPLLVSVTVEQVGTMLLGSEIAATLAAIIPYQPAAFGINCATGPEAMEEHLRGLSNVSPFPILCQPNAGMPQNVNGKACYTLEPEQFAATLATFVRRYQIGLAGGCCGTTPRHIAALAQALKREPRGVRTQKRATGTTLISSLYTAVPLDQEPRPFLIAEQTNVNGSKKFRELLLANDYDAMAEMGRRAAEGAHALDVCVAYAGRDEIKDMSEVVRRLTLKADAPLMIDSTNVAALEAALAVTPGRAIVNSINLEDGGTKARQILALVRRFGSALVALTIDEQGMARTAEAKLAVARRLVALAKEAGLEEGDLLIDPLTFTLASGDSSLTTAGRETLNAIEGIHREFPGVRTVLGVSNISFGLPGPGRAILTSMFLHRAVKAGLSAAIINPVRVMPMARIPEALQQLCTRLIDGDAAALAELITAVQALGGTIKEPIRREEPKTPREVLAARVIDGSQEGLAGLIDQLVREMAPSAIINEVLLPAMQEVGRAFSEGRTALPFVLQSAEAMRAAIDLTTPHLTAGEQIHRGTIVLATVRGDVHDIGKNLVEAILANNGFKVVNLGIRQPASAIIEAVRAQKANAIGLSGLLVSSTEIMREDLELFREAGLTIPVLCGGAALTPAFVEGTLAKAYNGPVRYCADAFAGLTEMERIAT